MSKQRHGVPYKTSGPLRVDRKVKRGHFVWDRASEMWYDEKSQFYFEEKSKLYAKRNHPQWYSFDTKQNKLVKTDR